MFSSTFCSWNNQLFRIILGNTRNFNAFVYFKIDYFSDPPDSFIHIETQCPSILGETENQPPDRTTLIHGEVRRVWTWWRWSILPPKNDRIYTVFPSEIGKSLIIAINNYCIALLCNHRDQFAQSSAHFEIINSWIAWNN